jgi:hypothetical protein
VGLGCFIFDFYFLILTNFGFGVYNTTKKILTKFERSKKIFNTPSIEKT